MRTRSPTVKRTKCLRILPETCARTSCSLSSLTRNIVPGSTLEIVPSTSIGSSLIRFLSAAELPRLRIHLPWESFVHRNCHLPYGKQAFSQTKAGFRFQNE